jgi:hypothetical protein
MVAKTKPERDMETMACRETMEAHLEEEELTSVGKKPEAAEQQELPIEDATVMLVGEPKRIWHRDRKLAAERLCQKPNNSTREKCGSQTILAIVHRGTSCHAKVARQTKETGRKMSGCTRIACHQRSVGRRNYQDQVRGKNLETQRKSADSP